MKIQLVSFAVQGLILQGFMSKAISFLLTELVGQSRGVLPLAFSALTSLLSVNIGKAGVNLFLH